MINVFQPDLGPDELAAVGEVFADNWLGHGPRSRAFEEEFAGHVGVERGHTVFLNSATAGLFLAMELLGLGPGDEVVLPSVCFVSAANAIVATGARPVFCDVDEHRLNPRPEDVEAALTPATRAVVVLHYGGSPGDVAPIASLLRARGIPLVEDAACAVASSVDGRACGTFGDIAVWSFDAMKIVVTGDGGMLYARDPELVRRARRLAYHGLERASGFSSARDSPRGARGRWWDLDVRETGRRLIGNDLAAALGSVQLRRLPEFLAARAAVAERYDALLAAVPGLRLPPAPPAGHRTSHYFYWIQLDPRLRDEVAAELLDAGVYTTFRYPPLHRVPAFHGEPLHDLPATDRAAASTLLLPMHQALSAEDVTRVCATLDRVLGPARERAGDVRVTS